MSLYNWAEMRIWVEKNVSHRGKREQREEISYYRVNSKGIWKFFAILGFSLLPPCVFD